MKNPFKRTEKTEKKSKPVQLIPGRGSLMERLNARDRAREYNDGSIITSTSVSHSPSNVSQPDPARGTVQKSNPHQDARSLRGDMIHRSPKTLRGKSVIPDKKDRREQ